MPITTWITEALDNRSVVEDIANLYVAACPKLAFEAEHCRSKQGEKKGRLRLGFLSSFLRNHSIGKLLRGIIENFPRHRFEVIVFRLPGETDEISEFIDRAAISKRRTSASFLKRD